jgi:hypothetical protein
MIGTVRGVFTVAGAGIAGLLIWIATQIDRGSIGGYWGAYGILAGAGLTMALSQLFGGWTKWGWPRVSIGVFLIGFLPTLVAAGWVLLAAQPDTNWFQRHIVSWSGDVGIRGLVDDLRQYLGVLAFGLGLVFGFTFDTSGPRVAAETVPAGPPVAEPIARTEPVAPVAEPVEPAARRVEPVEPVTEVQTSRPAEPVTSGTMAPPGTERAPVAREPLEEPAPVTVQEETRRPWWRLGR